METTDGNGSSHLCNPLNYSFVSVSERDILVRMASHEREKLVGFSFGQDVGICPDGILFVRFTTFSLFRGFVETIWLLPVGSPIGVPQERIVSEVKFDCGLRF